MSITPETPVTPAAGPPLPDYLQAAKPNPVTNRAAWYLSTAPTYAGIFLWFVFWNSMPNNGLWQGGLWVFLAGTVIAGLICHFLFYLVPGLLGKRTGLPLYIVGTSTFGAVGGLLMPGFLMGLLQFGWLAVNTYFSSALLADSTSSPLFYILCIAWGAAAAFVGLKGIQYVAKIATFLPLIPLAVLALALVKFGPSAGDYHPSSASSATAAPNVFEGLTLVIGAIVGFFATAGAAGVDFGMNNRDRRDVQFGGLGGILLATVFTAGAAGIAVAGAHVDGALPNHAINEQIRKEGTADKVSGDKINAKVREASYTLTNGLRSDLDSGWFKIIMIGLTLAAFPGACFSSFIAANSFKTVMPRVNPFLSVGIGALVSIILAVTQVAGNLAGIFEIIGASFGPICGAMAIDYLLAGGRWAGPRAGFNPAGWIAWLVGFVVGISPTLSRLTDGTIPAVPASAVAAFLVGALVYYVLARAGLQSAVLPYPPAVQQNEA